MVRTNNIDVNFLLALGNQTVDSQKRDEIKKELRSNHLEYLVDKLFEKKGNNKSNNYVSYENSRKEMFKKRNKK